MTGIEGSAVTDRYERLAFFDDADDYTPYLATRAGDALFLVKTEDKHIARSLFAKQGRGELAVIGRAVRAIEGLFGTESITGRTLIDVGANIGTTTIPAVLSHGFAKAVAIEPEPENFRVLQLNLMLNEVEDRVTALMLAASNQSGRSELMVTRGRGGKHWIVTDRSKLKRRSPGPETSLLEVETSTLDRLVELGTIDPEQVALLWMDAEAHEGHILEGASALLVRGVPLVLEWNPVILDRVGNREKLESAVAAHYTHFATMGRNPNPDEARFPLRPVDELPEFAQPFLDPDDPATKTDILVLRLAPEQASGIASLDDLLGQTPEADESELPPPPGVGRLIARLRARLRRG